MDTVPRPLATVNVTPSVIEEGRLTVDTGRAALPGAFVRPREDADVKATALRVPHERYGAAAVHLKQLAVLPSRPRDPRDRSLSVAHIDALSDADGALDRAAFRREILDAGFLEETGEMTKPAWRAARPAMLYRRPETVACTQRDVGAGR